MPQDCGAKSRAFLFRSNCITAGTMVGGPGISKSVDRGRWMKGCGEEACAKLRVLAARSSTAAVWMQQIACQKWHHLWKRAAKCNWMRAGHRQCAWTSLLASFKMPGDRRMDGWEPEPLRHPHSGLCHHRGCSWARHHIIMKPRESGCTVGRGPSTYIFEPMGMMHRTKWTKEVQSL